MRQPAGEAAGEQASDNERHGPQDTQERDERHQPPGPARITAQEQDLVECRREQGERQQSASPPAAPVVTPHRHDPDPEERGNGWRHPRQVVLMKEAGSANEDAHCEQSRAPQDQG